MQKLLKTLLKKWEAGSKARLFVREKDSGLRPLFEFSDNSGPRLYSLLQALEKEPYQVLSIRQGSGRRPVFAVEYEGACLELNPAAVPMLRQWLETPAFDADQLSLRDAVFNRRDCFADQGRSLLAAAGRMKWNSFSVDALVEAFASIPQRASTCLTLRELSASCFWGDSKFLEQREDLLASLFPDLALAGRRQLLQVFLPDVTDGILFVENQDTFTRACQGLLAGAERLAIVYGAGFRAASEGIRLPGRALFAFVDVIWPGHVNIHPADNLAQRRLFEFSWHDVASTSPVYFFGDLDDAGMGILAGLRRQFPLATAWLPGYEPLLSVLQAGGGHLPGQAGKSMQVAVSITGCAYADNVLIPALRQTGRYVDQEFQSQ